jgi:UDP-N-acetyl-D-galactosamine dehydrogenase
MGIDTQEVLGAADTKLNVLAFKRALLGVHCIGLDSYYFAQKTKAYRI